MTKYFKHLNDNNEIINLYTYDFEPIIKNPAIVEITYEEYHTILNQWQQIADSTRQERQAQRRAAIKANYLQSKNKKTKEE